jgi:hypothetical protein
MFKAPGNTRLILKRLMDCFQDLLSISTCAAPSRVCDGCADVDGAGAVHVVGRCRFTLSKPALKAPGSERLKLKRDDALSNFAFKFNLRRYNMEAAAPRHREAAQHGGQGGAPALP